MPGVVCGKLKLDRVGADALVRPANLYNIVRGSGSADEGVRGYVI